jgi:hypothetical protein
LAGVALGVGLAEPASGLVELDVSMASPVDDVEEIFGGAMDRSSSDLELVEESGDPNMVGLRFAGVDVPAGSTIQTAWIQFEADETESGTILLTIEAHADRDAPVFSLDPNSVSSRPATAGSVLWSPPAWNLVGEADIAQRTPDLATLVQQVVDQPQWAAGNAIAFMISGTGQRVATSWDKDPAGAASLHIEYDPPPVLPPTLEIEAPWFGTTANLGMTIAFAGNAQAGGGADLSSTISWSSDLDGALALGASFTRDDLQQGLHEITVSVSDAALTTEKFFPLRIFPEVPVVLAAGDIAACDKTGDEATGDVLDGLPGWVLPVGDLVYDDGTAQEFEDCYGPSWGRHTLRSRPAVGNHEYITPDATPYFDWFGDAAGDPAEGWYSYDIGDWHVVNLNSNCGEVGGCEADSPQGQWLAADLAANPSDCTLAYFHHPRFASRYAGIEDDVLDFWQILYDNGVDVLLSGHDHAYERFARMAPDGTAEPTRGIRSFVVGMGGKGHHAALETEINRDVRNDTDSGVLELTLNPGSYTWAFRGEAGGSFQDSGSENCVVGTPLVTIASPLDGRVITAGSQVSFLGSALDPEDGDLSSSLAWTSSLDGAIGSGSAFSYGPSLGSHVITASVTDSAGNSGSQQVVITMFMVTGSCGLGAEVAVILAGLSLLGRRARKRRVASQPIG